MYWEIIWTCSEYASRAMERINLEVNEQNLQALANRLQETLSLEKQIRKDGKRMTFSLLKHLKVFV